MPHQSGARRFPSHCESANVAGRTFCKAVLGHGADDPNCRASEKVVGSRAIKRCALQPAARAKNLALDEGEGGVSCLLQRNTTGKGSHCVRVRGGGRLDAGCGVQRFGDGRPSLCYRHSTTPGLKRRYERVGKGDHIHLRVVRSQRDELGPDEIDPFTRFCVPARLDVEEEPAPGQSAVPNCAWRQVKGPDGKVLQRHKACTAIVRKTPDGQKLPPRCVQTYAVGGCAKADGECRFSMDNVGDSDGCRHAGQGICVAPGTSRAVLEASKRLALRKLRRRMLSTARVCQMAVPSTDTGGLNAKLTGCRLLSAKPLYRMPKAARAAALSLCKASATGSGRCVPTKQGRVFLRNVDKQKAKLVRVPAVPSSAKVHDAAQRRLALRGNRAFFERVGPTPPHGATPDALVRQKKHTDRPVSVSV